MAAPNTSELIFYTNKPLNSSDYRTNWLKVIEWLTTTYDVAFYNIVASGNVTAVNFIGNGSQLTGIDVPARNWLINAEGKIIKSSTAYTLVKDTYGTQDNYWYGMATGTAVTAGTFGQDATATIGRALFAHKFTGVTASGTGIVYLRYRMQSQNAKTFKNQIASFQALVYQNTGGAINYTIYVRKATALDNFTAVTEITNSGQLSVPDSTSTQIKLEEITMEDCSNGVEIEIKVECGAVTTKDFEFTELQFELGSVAESFSYEEYENDYNNALISQFFAFSDNAITINNTLHLADSNAIYFGTGNDATILYNGTNLLINPKAVGSGYLGVSGNIGIGANYISNDGDNEGISIDSSGNVTVSGTITIPTTTRYYSVSPAAFVPLNDSSLWQINGVFVVCSDTSTVTLYAPVNLPHNAIITKLTMDWYRVDAAASGTGDLVRGKSDGSSTIMASADSDSSSGYHSVEDSSIVNPTVDNTDYQYFITITLNPNDTFDEVRFLRAQIDYTIDKPLP
jgi:hypothetical protein